MSNKINPLAALGENPDNKDISIDRNGVAAFKAEKAFASDFDRIVAEDPTSMAKRLGDGMVLKDIDQGGQGMVDIYGTDAIEEVPNPAPSEIEKK